MATRTVLFLLIAVFAACGKADVPQLRGRLFAARAQRQQLANPTPYPAAGYRPDRQFGLPQEPAAQNAPESGILPDQQTLQRPDQLYGAPTAQQNFLPQQQPQITYGAPDEEPQAAPAAAESQRLRAKPARLTNNREDQEDDDDSRTDIEADTNVEEKKTVAAQPAPAPTATIVYYPAGAVGFVQPGTAAGFAQPAATAAAYSFPAQAPIFAKLQAQPAAFAAAAAPQPQQFFAQPQFFQPQAAPFFGAQLRAW